MRRINTTGAWAALVVLNACDLTHVTAPGVVQPPAYNNPAGAIILRAGAIGEFASQWSFQALYSGLLVDEFRTANGFSSGFPEDQRNLNYINSTDYPYTALSHARLDALNAIGALKVYAPQPAWQIGELYGLVASIEIAFRENMCSGVPLATLVNGTPTLGPTLSGSQLLTRALADLDSAATYLSANDSLTAFIAVLRGRALLDSGNLAAAATAIANVPPSFAYAVPLDTSTQQINYIYKYLSQYHELSVSDREGTNGLPFVSANDPRVPTTTIITSNDTIYAPANDNSVIGPLLLASGTEAGLISAEASLASGDVTSWSGALNTLREAAGIPPLPLDSTTMASPTLRLAVQFRERAFWLFGTGHRHGDVRRLVRYYGLPVNAVFPAGLYEGGPSIYGNSVVFPPVGESSNPNFHGCVDMHA